ncbi:MAG: hypothetical protein HYX69_01090 [Planctomycetia bacterium]|nr:hypothetical protein [Planctomycetia bacterium]
MSGIDAATGYMFLMGFREWLIPTANGKDNLHWTGIVLDLAFPGVRDPEAYLRESGDHTHAIAVLFDHLTAFLDRRQEPTGMREIYARFESWLRTQEWYTSASPLWLSNDTKNHERK